MYRRGDIYITVHLLVVVKTIKDARYMRYNNPNMFVIRQQEIALYVRNIS